MRVATGNRPANLEPDARLTCIAGGGNPWRCRVHGEKWPSGTARCDAYRRARVLSAGERRAED